MGAAPDVSQVKRAVSGSGSGSAGSVSDKASGAVDTLGVKAQGNPLAAGLVAFGAGMLISALIPASEKETQVTQRAVEAAKEHGRRPAAASAGRAPCRPPAALGASLSLAGIDPSAEVTFDAIGPAASGLPAPSNRACPQRRMRCPRPSSWRWTPYR